MCGDFGQCPEDAALDGAVRHAAGEISATTIDIRLVPFESGGSTAAAIVCLPRPMDVDRRSFPTAADTSKLSGAVDAAAGRKIWTAAITHI